MSGQRQPADSWRRGLGFLSVALGLPLLGSPGVVADTIGVGQSGASRRALAGVGVREFAAATALLWPGGSPRWLWARVFGDALDLALLGRAVRAAERSARHRTLAAMGAVAGITGVDLFAALTRGSGDGWLDLTGVVTVGCEPAKAYEHWRIERLPSFMAHVDDVRIIGRGRSRWQASAPFGRTVTWEAEVVEELPGHRLAWRSLPGADVSNEGKVEFTAAAGGRGTEVRVELRYRLPGGRLGTAAARYFGEDPHQALDDDLRRFKQIVETGRVVRSDGAPEGKRARDEFPQHPARPLDDGERERLETVVTR